MPRMTRDEALTILRSRPLFNQEMIRAKNVLSVLFERAHRDAIREPFVYGGKFKDLPEEVLELDYLDWSLHRVPGLIKKVRACKSNDACVTAMILFLNDWEDVATTLVDAKKDAIKGRRPVAEADRRTPPRTLENTGTCAVCGHNVKLHYGSIVDHGFQLQFGMRRGRCFGVDYSPWEVAPDGKIDYADAVRQEIKRIQEEIEGFQVEPDADPSQVQRDLSAAESELRYARKTLQLLEEEINNWEPQALPGE